jgi:thymidine kinase
MDEEKENRKRTTREWDNGKKEKDIVVALEKDVVQQQQPTPQFGGFKGEIQVILGPMFSGKTTELLRRIQRYTIAKRSCVVIKYAKDTRYSVSCASTHDSREAEAVAATNLFDVREQIERCDVIGIDEGQFFPDLVAFADQMANEGRVVIVAALDGTFQRQAFGDVLHLIPLAESVLKLSAVCMTCYGSAAFTKRLGAETKVEVIGGADKYLAVCRRCYAGEPITPGVPHAKKQRRVYADRERLLAEPLSVRSLFSK